MKILDARTDARTVSAIAERKMEFDPDVERRAREIIAKVRAEGDEAVTTLTRQLDCRYIDSLGLRVGSRELERSYQMVSKEFLAALRRAARNIRRFHLRQVQKSWEIRADGMRLGQRFRPLARVGLYIPGGKAAYPSTVLMNAIPAVIAGVKEVVMTTPCNARGKIAPEVLVAAAECGIREMYRVGGAQAIAVLAYGTESIRRVDKITGPGNAYVAAAKRLVFGAVGIDAIAGPTEIVIVADSTADPRFIAADLLAQAEHDELAAPICIVTSLSLAGAVDAAVSEALSNAPRQGIARQSFDRHGVIIIARNVKEALDFVNLLAPEHCELLVRNAHAHAAKVANAGSVFVGSWSTEALGDYAAGPNHTLPTAGTARFSSPLGVGDYMKFTNVIEVSRPGFHKIAGTVETLARVEGLYGHIASVAVRRGR
jgi:histidinol dehydrogenase